MGLFRRLVPLVKSWLGALLAPAPDPRQTFVNAYQRQRELLARVQRALAEISASKGRLDAKARGAREAAPARGQPAGLMAGREDLARLALQRARPPP
jgi:phage shock protein A